jgi:hypothetical protein
MNPPRPVCAARPNVAAARALLHGLQGQVRWFSDGDFLYPAQHLVLDTETLDPAGCASASFCTRRWRVDEGNADRALKFGPGVPKRPFALVPPVRRGLQ